MYMFQFVTMCKYVKCLFQCKPEYKVPGLYVIDSIIRQSRHQFGSDKDAFASRFTKNIVSTFQNLFKCPPDERVSLNQLSRHICVNLVMVLTIIMTIS